MNKQTIKTTKIIAILLLYFRCISSQISAGNTFANKINELEELNRNNTNIESIDKLYKLNTNNYIKQIFLSMGEFALEALAIEYVAYNIENHIDDKEKKLTLK